MSTDHDFERRLAESWPPECWQDVSLLLAVSGGADSVALARGIHALKQSGAGQVVVAHLNHGLRGEESEADQQAVVELCRQLDLPCELGRRDVAAAADEAGDGLEAAAREERYDFLHQTARRLGARYVVTAHTADDQAETILHRILRGTGLTGLAGMPRSRPLSEAVSLIRPMLDMRRSDVLDYLTALGQPFRQDASNRDPRFTRSRIRCELLPQLERDYNPAVVDALLRLGTLSGEVQATIDHEVAKLADSVVTSTPSGELTIDCQKLGGVSSYLLRELLIHLWRGQGWPQQSMGYAQWEKLSELALSDAETQLTLPGTIMAQKKDGQLMLTRPCER